MIRCPVCKEWQAFSGKECRFCSADTTVEHSIDAPLEFDADGNLIGQSTTAAFANLFREDADE